MKAKRLLNISRPRFWIYELGPYVVGVAAAAGLHSSIWFSPFFLLFFIFFTYPANIFIYGINDIFDYETDKLNPKKIEYESLVSPTEHFSLALHIFIISLPFIISIFFLGSLVSISYLFAFFFFAGFYSAKPIRAKAKPFLDSFFSAAHYIATAGFSFFLTKDFISASLPVSSWDVTLCLIAGLSWAMAMHAFSAVPDIQADSEAHLSTVATYLGKHATIIFCAFLYALSGFISFYFIGITGICLSALYILFMILSYRSDEKRLFKLYTFFPFINTISGAIIFFSVLLK